VVNLTCAKDSLSLENMTETSFSPSDWGPIYKETVYGRWPVEPWNTATTLFFFLFVAYWAFKIRKDWKQHPLLVATLPLIFVGFVGGFLYHSFRDNKLWLIMDWGPIVLTALVCCVYYWQLLLQSWFKGLLATIIPLALSVALLKILLPFGLFAAMGYPLLAILVLTPLVLSVRKKSFNDLRYLVYATLCVCTAIVLRSLDRTSAMDFLPMGSHFLWHTVGALTCHFFIRFNYENFRTLNRSGKSHQSPSH
jgi:hypothetical protein